MTKIFVFGNKDLEEDNLPLRILPKLREKFPDIRFETKDPNEEWEIPESEELIILDTTVGIKDVEVFDDLEKFSKVPRMGMHDFDALTNLRYIKKLGKIKKIKIIGVPPDMGEQEAVKILERRISGALD
jgi:hypothetical protein